jgi:hypothetical protein
MGSDINKKTPYPVMLSGTYRELTEHREVVRKAMLALGLLPVAVEDDSALSDQDLIDASLAKVEECDAYVGLISYRYGQVTIDPIRNPEQLSLTELEFRRAVARKIPICMFVMHEDHPVPRRAVGAERGVERKFKAFVQLVKKDRIYAEFKSVDDLKAKAVQSLVKLREIRERSAAPISAAPMKKNEHRAPRHALNRPGLSLDVLQDLRLAAETKQAGINPAPQIDTTINKAIIFNDLTANYETKGVWLLFLGAAAAIAAGWVLHREIAYVATSLIELFRSAVAPLPARRSATLSADVVDASAFAPEECAPGETILVQIFFHRRTQASAAKKRAQEADRQATRRTFCTFETAVNRGQRLGVKLESQYFSIEQSEQSVVWRGEPCMCQFSLTSPRSMAVRSDQLQVSFFLDGTPIGILRFNIVVTFTLDGLPKAPTLRGDSSRHFEYAFLSYSSQDRREVLQCAQVLQGVGVDFFLDAVSLRSGEIWEQRLYEEIDRSDIFMLFWSKNAEQHESKWIEREATYALRLQKTSKDQLPCFRPAFLGDDKPRRPSWLPTYIQFDNALRRHLLAARHDQGDQ